MKNIFTFKRNIGYLASAIIFTTGTVTMLSGFNNYQYQFDGQTFTSRAQLNEGIEINKKII